MSAIKRINNEINRKFPKNIIDLYTSYNLSFLSYDTDFTNSDYITLSVDIYNTYCSSFKQLFTINLYKTYPFTPPRPLINTKYGNKNYNRWCGDITNTINKRLFLSSTNILIASFFSIDMNTTLYKKFKNTPVKFPINFRKKEQVYFDVKKRLSSLLSDKSKCNNLLVLKKSNKLKISMNTIKSRIADLSPNIEYLIKNLGLFEVSKPLFSGNVGFVYIICDTQNAENEENIKIKKNEMMNKHLLNLSNKILKRLIKQAQISQIQKIN